MKKTALVLGLGNVLYGDEGLGVHLIRHLKLAYRFSGSLELIDGGALGFELAGLIARYEQVFILDAIAGDPGAVYCFSPADLPPGSGSKLSSHEWEVMEVLWALGLTGELPEVVFFAVGVEPRGSHGTSLGVGVSPPVRAGMRRLVRALVAELDRAGYAPTPTGAKAPLDFAIEELIPGEERCTKPV